MPSRKVTYNDTSSSQLLVIRAAWLKGRYPVWLLFLVNGSFLSMFHLLAFIRINVKCYQHNTFIPYVATMQIRDETFAWQSLLWVYMLECFVYYLHTVHVHGSKVVTPLIAKGLYYLTKSLQIVGKLKTLEQIPSGDRICSEQFTSKIKLMDKFSCKWIVHIVNVHYILFLFAQCLSNIIGMVLFITSLTYFVFFYRNVSSNQLLEFPTLTNLHKLSIVWAHNISYRYFAERSW